jgi:hypothetical protein
MGLSTSTRRSSAPRLGSHRLGRLLVVWALVASATVGLVSSTTSAEVRAPVARPWPASDTWEASTAPVVGCDPIVADPSTATSCLLPFPDDFLTVHDATSPTGRRVDFPAGDMAANVAHKRIDPTAWNLQDGFSPGSPIVVHVPGVDLTRSGVAPITNIGASVQSTSPVVLLDATTGARVPFWAELDANDSDAGEQALLIHPAVNFADGDHIVVAMRRLVDSSGALIASNPVFRDYKLGLPLPTPAEQARIPHMEAIFSELTANHITRNDLYLAWDFTVASTQGLTGRMTHIRDDAFAQLGSAAPTFSVTSSTDLTTAQDPSVARQVIGTFQVPNYLSGTGGPGATFTLDANGLPVRNTVNPTITANFECIVPRDVISSGSPAAGGSVYPAHAMLYGHGLLGSADEVTSGAQEHLANEHDFVICGTNWLGLSEDDVGTDAGILSDISLFPTLPDRGQQGMLDFLYLGRLMDGGGFDTAPAFQSADGTPLIAPHDLSYDGNSQGGIQGGALTAVGQDFTRSVLGVPGMDYAVLLNRSVDFAPFLAFLNGNYPDKLDQAIGYGVMEMLWDRSEMDGYANHITSNPLEGTPVHQVLLDEAFGDHQVANVAAENEARTIGAKVHEPGVAAGRSADVVPFYGIAPLPSTPYAGSALFMWDSGSPRAPLTNTPPSAGADPHEVPRSQPLVREQAAAFLLGGYVLNVCGNAPCTAVP